MTASKLSSLTPMAIPGPDDLFYVVTKPLSPSSSKSLSFANLQNALSVIRDKGGQVFNVKAFGAVGDGQTDDRAAIQAAYAAASTVYGTLYFPQGTYLVKKNGVNSYALLLDGLSVYLQGVGVDSKIVGDGGDYALLKIPSSGTTARVHIQDMLFDGGRAGVFPAENSNFAVQIQKATIEVKIVHNTFENFDEDGVYLGENAALVSQNIIITDNLFRNGGRTGVAVVSANKFNISNNIFENMDHQAIDVEPALTYFAIHGIVSGNLVRGGGNAVSSGTRQAISVNHQTGAAAAVAGKIIVTDNVVTDYGLTTAELAHGYTLGALQNAIVSNNIAYHNGYFGFNVTNCVDLTFVGNQAANNLNIGILIDVCTRVTSIGNYSYSNGVADYGGGSNVGLVRLDRTGANNAWILSPELRPSSNNLAIAAANVLLDNTYGLQIKDTSGTQTAIVNLTASNNVQVNSPYVGGSIQFQVNNASGGIQWVLGSTVRLSLTAAGLVEAGGVFLPVQAPTASAPAYVKGGLYFDTTLNKLMVGGATGWEAVTSV